MENTFQSLFSSAAKPQKRFSLELPAFQMKTPSQTRQQPDLTTGQPLAKPLGGDLSLDEVPEPQEGLSSFITNKRNLEYSTPTNTLQKPKPEPAGRFLAFGKRSSLSENSVQKVQQSVSALNQIDQKPQELPFASAQMFNGARDQETKTEILDSELHADREDTTEPQGMIIEGNDTTENNFLTKASLISSGVEELTENLVAMEDQLKQLTVRLVVVSNKVLSVTARQPQTSEKVREE